jgi:hypothetical protein
VLAERTGGNADDFEFRVVAIALVAAMMEAATEWVRQDGRVSIGALMKRSLDTVQADSMLDSLSLKNS